MKSGFTLIELLAVMVVLAIILVITVPQILGVIEQSKVHTFENNGKLIIDAIKNKMSSDDSFNPANIDETNIKSVLGLEDENYKEITVKQINGVIYITIVGQNKWNELTASGTSTDIKVENTVTTLTNGANSPVLAIGMTPIKWNGSTWIETTVNDSAWYNYDTTNKEWANARTEDGSMWVWIPRYIYKINSNWHNNLTGTIDIQFSKGTDDNWNKSSIGAIVLSETSNASNNTWTNHPAFTFGSLELTGIWVAKFEATASEGVDTADGSCLDSNNTTTKTVKIIPNVVSWRCIQVGNMFTVSRNMETNNIYGWGTSGNGIDTHLMKNIEWGAISYLSKSQYGKNDEEIYINNSQTYTTGCSGTTVSATAYNGCQNTYNTTNGVKASTTGNIYGVYDMAGSAWERVSAYVNNSNDNLIAYGLPIINADNKYKDIYTKGNIDDQISNYNLTLNKKGDALYETSNNINGTYSWYSDYSYMPITSSPWLSRGGDWGYGSTTGIFFFANSWGGAGDNNGFRPVLAISPGL